jgi:hypothetical protein
MTTTKKSLISAMKVSGKAAEASAKTKGKQVASLSVRSFKKPSARMAVSARKANSFRLAANHNQTLR